MGDELLAQALAEKRVQDIFGDDPNAGFARLVDRSRFLFERPRVREDRPVDYDRDGFKAWICEELRFSSHHEMS